MRDHELAEAKAEKRAAWEALGRLERAKLVWNRSNGSGPELEALEGWQDETRARFEDARGRYLRLVLGRWR